MMKYTLEFTSIKIAWIVKNVNFLRFIRHLSNGSGHKSDLRG